MWILLGINEWYNMKEWLSRGNNDAEREADDLISFVGRKSWGVDEVNGTKKGGMVKEMLFWRIETLSG